MYSPSSLRVAERSKTSAATVGDFIILSCLTLTVLPDLTAVSFRSVEQGVTIVESVDSTIVFTVTVAVVSHAL